MLVPPEVYDSDQKRIIPHNASIYMDMVQGPFFKRYDSLRAIPTRQKFTSNKSLKSELLTFTHSLSQEKRPKLKTCKEVLV